MLKDVEAVKALSDPERLRIMSLIEQEAPVSAAEIARILDTSAPRISYHFKILEKHGLIALVDTVMKGNLVEKRFQPVASQIEINLSHDPASGSAEPFVKGKMLKSMGNVLIDEVRAMLDRGEPMGAMSVTTCTLASSEVKQLCLDFLSRIRELERRPLAPGSIEVRRPVKIGLMAFNTDESKDSSIH